MRGRRITESIPVLHLGPFELQAHLATGGMGQVWRGQHRPSGLEVAIKVVTATWASDPAFRLRFAHEVRAVASLRHPGIITVYDHGEVGRKGAEQSGGELVQGSPYLAMELADGGTLLDLEPITRFDDLLHILLALLDSLSHAHARGVVHRDIKPGNVLVWRDEAGRAAKLKLSDFGIARTEEDEVLSSVVEAGPCGTPAYMAPEQIQADWRNQGPWTDLYAVGCLVYRLVAGQVPFAHPSGRDDQYTVAGHLHASPPSLKNRVPIPQGFEDWVHRLLQKAPGDRFRYAADAARALLELRGNPLIPPVEDAIKNDPGDAPTVLVPTLTTVRLPAGYADSVEIPGPTRTADELSWPIVPASWRQTGEEAGPPPRPLRGVGLGLYGLRPVPFVGRIAERDQLWQALGRVAEERTASLVLLRGAAGSGKSRLAEWLTQRAEELGVAQVLKATHSPSPQPTDGLSHMLGSILRCRGMTRRAMLAHVRRVLGTTDADAHLAPALVELMRPTGRTLATEARARGGVRFGSQTERYAAIEQLLARWGRAKPIILWLEDVQWGSEALGLALHLLMQAPGQPILLVLTLRDEALLGRSAAARRVNALTAQPASQTIPVPHLDDEAHSQLVERILGLEGDLADQVRVRTGGNPLFAVQLVGDWVQRGVLEATPGGFRLRAGERAHLPDDIHAMWQSRINRLVQGFPDGVVLPALEMAAALGQEIDPVEWKLCCEAEGFRLPERLSDVMLASRLATSTDRGWAFAHGMLRESLERGARRAERWASHHEACAATLERRPIDDEVAHLERLAHHQRAAHQLLTAQASLRSAAERRLSASDFTRALELCREREQTLTEAETAEGDPRFVDNWLLTARILTNQAEFEEAERYLARVEANTPAAPSQGRAQVLFLRAEAARHQGEGPRAFPLAEQAHQEMQSIGNALGAADCRRLQAELHLESTGDHEAARVHLAAAEVVFQRVTDLERLAKSAYCRAKLHTQLGELDEAWGATLEAQSNYEKTGSRYGAALCLNHQGEIARAGGDFAAAEGYYRRSLDLMRALGAQNATVAPRLNLALVAIGRGELDAAVQQLEALRGDAVAPGFRQKTLSYVDYSLLLCAAKREQWERFDTHVTDAARWRPETGRVDGDLARLAADSGNLALSAGETTRAHAALRLALDHAQALGRGTLVASIRAQLDKEEPAG